MRTTPARHASPPETTEKRTPAAAAAGGPCDPRSPAQQRQRHQGHDLRGAEQPHQQRGVGQQVQLEGQGDEGCLCPQVGDEVAAHDQAQVAAVTKRREVGPQAGETHPIEANWRVAGGGRSATTEPSAGASPRDHAMGQSLVEALPGGAPPAPLGGGPCGRRSEAHVFAAAWNFLLR